MSLVAHGIIAAIPMKAGLKGLAHELAEYHNKDTGLCCPSLDKLAHNLCCDVRTIRRGLAELEEAGVIRRDFRFAASRQTTTNYVFVVTDLSGRGDTSVRGEEDASVRGEEDTSVRQNRKKEPKEETKTVREPKTATYNGEIRSFERWWAMYPKKVAKLAAIKAWDRLTDGERASAYADCVTRQWADDHQYDPNPATYLNGRRWDDDNKRTANDDLAWLQEAR